MKKLKFLLIIVLVLSIYSLSEASTSLLAEAGLFNIFINGREEKFKKPIVTINGDTYLPLREVCDKLKINLNWDSNSKSIYLNIKEAGIHVFETIDGKFGFADKDNNVVISPTYSYAEEFFEGRALVSKSSSAAGQFGFINESGEEVIPCIYYDATSFNEGIAVVSLAEHTEAQKFIYIDSNGDKLFNKEFDAASGFSEGYAVVLKEGRLFPQIEESSKPKWSYINKNGEFATDMVFEEAGDFFNGYACVKNNGKWGLINSKFEIVVPYQYDEIKILKEAKGEIYGRINNNWGKIII